MQVVNEVLDMGFGKGSIGCCKIGKVVPDGLVRTRGGRDRNGLDRALSRIGCSGLDRTPCGSVRYAFDVVDVDMVGCGSGRYAWRGRGVAVVRVDVVVLLVAVDGGTLSFRAAVIGKAVHSVVLHVALVVVNVVVVGSVVTSGVRWMGLVGAMLVLVALCVMLGVLLCVFE